MKKMQSGRTLIETLGVLAVIGILSVSGLQLYAKAMNTIRANYIMEQIFIKANELAKDPVSSRRKVVDISVQTENTLSRYGYSFSTSDDSKPQKSGNDFIIGIEGHFPISLCKILKKKIKTQEYAGLKNIKANSTVLKEADCPTDDDIDSMVFTIDAEFKEQSF